MHIEWGSGQCAGSNFVAVFRRSETLLHEVDSLLFGSGENNHSGSIENNQFQSNKNNQSKIRKRSQPSLGM